MKSAIFGLSMIAVAYGQCNGYTSDGVTYPADECFLIDQISSYEYDCDTEAYLLYSSSSTCNGTSESMNTTGGTWTCDAFDCDFVTIDEYDSGSLFLEIGIALESCANVNGSSEYVQLECCDSGDDYCFEFYTDDDCSTSSSTSSIALGDSDYASSSLRNYTAPTDSDCDAAWRVDMGIVSMLLAATALLR